MMTNKTVINWTRIVIALLFMGSVFSFNALAQTNTDKPMAAKSLAALIEELKGVVLKSTPDEKDALLVGKKWDKRKDLTGKTKRQVIELLYDDVESVIKDSGLRYQIYSIFSFYKQIPDKFLSVQTQKNKSELSKPKAVERLTNLTFPEHPYVGIDKLVAKLPGTKDIEAAKEEDRKNRIEGFDAALKVNNKLTADQKSFVRANYDQLIKIADKITEDAINKNFPTEQWIMEGLDRSYSAKFRLKELDDLITFFDSDNGRQVLKYVRQTNMAELITGNGGKLDYTDADKAEHNKFIATPLGEKFRTAFLKEAIEYEEGKENAVRSKNPDADGFAIYETENLNKLFNKFVAKNYKNRR